MGFKKFFIIDENESSTEKNKTQKETKTPVAPTTFPTADVKFPSSDVTFPKETFKSTYTVPPSVVNNPFLDKIMDVYDKGFTNLNQPGYDFFEFFKSVVKGGIDNPLVYEMALEIGQSMDSNVSKQSLLNQAEYYITELTKVHSGFNIDGQNKIDNLTNTKNSETNSLASEISSLKQQLNSIQIQIQTKENLLTEIGSKYQPELNEITYKLLANDIAKDRFISNINKVKSNISNNLK